jgi:hypothetical protein
VSGEATMADDPRDPQRLAPDEVAARVASILATAERDARAILAAARSEIPLAPGAPQHASGASPAGASVPGLGDLARALDSLAARLGTLEASTDARLGVLWDAVSPERGAAAEPLAPSDRGEPLTPSDPGEPPTASDPGKQEEEEASSTTTAGGPPAAAPSPVSPPTPGAAVRPWAEPVRVIDLALRGYTRAQIADELSGAMAPGEVERLLGEVLERS